MTIQLSVAARNARLDVIETVIGADAKLQLYTGAQPANCAAADSGTLLAEMTLPADWMDPASGGTKVKAGTWSVTGLAIGNFGHFRIKDNGETTCHMQGSVTVSGGGGDMIAEVAGIVVGQTVIVNTFGMTDANA
jgi:hypothetical protein